MVQKFLRKLLLRCGYELVPARHSQIAGGVFKPLDPLCVELLTDPEFVASLREVNHLTLLDGPRLGNLWQLCRWSNASGSILEVGTYRGGSALHLSNSAPARKIIVCDSFQGFRKLDPDLDQAFKPNMFKDASRDQVESLFREKGRNASVIEGFFPDSCRAVNLGPISFAYLDADTYESTKNALAFIHSKMIERSLILLDDFQRTAKGVDKAAEEFCQHQTDWSLFPLFPSQGLLVHRSWFQNNRL